MPGKFYGIGVGPGEPELITLKAYRILEKADIIFVPKSSAEGASFALDIVNKVLEIKGKVCYLQFPMSTDPETLRSSWDEAGKIVSEHLLGGCSAVFITIGDPMLYSTYGYLLDYLKKKHPDCEIETIPGVTAFSACASLVNSPLAEGEETLAVIPAAYSLDKLRHALVHFDNIVAMKTNRCFPEVLALLKELGLEDRAVFISRCGHEDQYFTRDLDSLSGGGLDYMSLLIVRKRGG